MSSKSLKLAAAAVALALVCAAPAAAQMLSNQSKTAAPASQVKAGALVIDAPWTRATPSGAKVAGGYVKITNTGTTPDKLIGGSLPVAGMVEVHEMTMIDNVMKMRRLDGLEIKPGATVELKPGGYHMMFMDLKDGLQAGQTMKGTLVFEKAGTVEVEYLVAPIGAPSRDAKKPATGGHAH